MQYEIKKILVLFVVILCGMSFAYPQTAPSPIPQSPQQQATNTQKFNTANKYYIEGCKKLDKGDLQGALKDFSYSIQYVGSPQAYFNRGFVKDELGDYMGAIDDYTECIRAAGDSEELQAEGFYNRAISLEKVKNYRAAMSDYNNAIQLNPTNADYYAKRAELNNKLSGFPSDTQNDMDKAITLEPENQNYVALENALQENSKAQSLNPQTPKKIVTEVIHEVPTANLSFEECAGRAKENLQARKFSDAIEYYTAAISKTTNQNEIGNMYYSRGECFKYLDYKEEAKQDYYQAVKLNPSLESRPNYLLY